jgi:hypothetical protein
MNYKCSISFTSASGKVFEAGCVITSMEYYNLPYQERLNFISTTIQPNQNATEKQ